MMFTRTLSISLPKRQIPICHLDTGFIFFNAYFGVGGRQGIFVHGTEHITLDSLKRDGLEAAVPLC